VILVRAVAAAAVVVSSAYTVAQQDSTGSGDLCRSHLQKQQQRDQTRLTSYATCFHLLFHSISQFFCSRSQARPLQGSYGPYVPHFHMWSRESLTGSRPYLCASSLRQYIVVIKVPGAAHRALGHNRLRVEVCAEKSDNSIGF
jgi:hypothetical protein